MIKLLKVPFKFWIILCLFVFASLGLIWQVLISPIDLTIATVIKLEGNTNYGFIKGEDLRHLKNRSQVILKTSHQTFPIKLGKFSYDFERKSYYVELLKMPPLISYLEIPAQIIYNSIRVIDFMVARGV